jgi:hypothetical protein
MYSVPGKTVKKELSKNIVTALLSGRVSVGRLDEIFAEIDTAEYTTSNPEVIIRAHETGLVGEQTASVALGFANEEYLQAREDHLARAKALLEAQTSAKAAQAGDNMAARGVPDLAENKDGGAQERAAVNDTTLQADKKAPVRGEGKSLTKGAE